ncbi:hypothetical protein ABTZ59_36330 [Streptomyces sp. NPDC094034]|uniref:hypothetical protein n=1 Tax=Streptomyces sp. NPDC094034 TaxID=3155309 RepID=UPI0033311D8A
MFQHSEAVGIKQKCKEHSVLESVSRGELDLPPASRENISVCAPAPPPSAIRAWDVKLCFSLVVAITAAVSLAVSGAFEGSGGVVLLLVLAGIAGRSTVRHLRIQLR